VATACAGTDADVIIRTAAARRDGSAAMPSAIRAARFRGAISALLLLALLSVAAPGGAAPDLQGPGPLAAPGPVVAIGGALREGNAPVWERLVALAGGPGARIAVLATASDDPVRTAASTVATLRRHGAEAFAVPVAPRLADSDARAAARDPRWVAQLQDAHGVFFTGGEQARIVDTLAPDGQASPLLAAIRALHARGGLVAGTSAGAAVLSGAMIRDAENVVEVLKGRLRAGQELGDGLGFAGDRLIVDQHFLERGRLGRLLPVLVERGLTLGIGVGEDTAAILRGEELEVVGAGGVLLVELDEAERVRGRQPFALRNARLALLGSGDRANLRTRTVTPAAHKLAGQLIEPAAAGFRPYYADVPFYLDVLGTHTVREAMTRLLESPAPEARGLAFDAGAPADDPLAALGFEFRFHKVPATRGWYSSAGDGQRYTIVDLRLDVTPVRVARPLYGAWSP
jgi:cyanophycinase